MPCAPLIVPGGAREEQTSVVWLHPYRTPSIETKYWQRVTSVMHTLITCARQCHASCYDRPHHQAFGRGGSMLFDATCPEPDCSLVTPVRRSTSTNETPRDSQSATAAGNSLRTSSCKSVNGGITPFTCSRWGSARERSSCSGSRGCAGSLALVEVVDESGRYKHPQLVLCENRLTR